MSVSNEKIMALINQAREFLPTSGDNSADVMADIEIYEELLQLRAKTSAAGAVPIDIEEYLGTYEWRTEDGGLAELTARDRHLLQDFANGLPLYAAPPAQAVSLTTPTLNASCVPEGQSCAITPCQYQDGSCAYCDDEGGTLFQSTKQACEWLAGRFEFSGIGDGVARSYAKHLRTMLAAAPEQKK